MSAEPILAIGDLAVEFPLLSGTVEAVRGCSLSIGKGEVMALVGESGCGKSMLALACLGLVPKPGTVRGSVKVAGREVVGRTDRELADLRGGRAAMIFQNPASALNPFFTVGTQLEEVVARHRGLSRSAARQAVIAAFEDVRLPDPEIALGKYPHQMSGGQLQRVMIAMAVACRPVLLIADEPTTALDVTIQAQIIVLLRDLVERTDLSPGRRRGVLRPGRGDVCRRDRRARAGGRLPRRAAAPLCTHAARRGAAPGRRARQAGGHLGAGAEPGPPAAWVSLPSAVRQDERRLQARRSGHAPRRARPPCRLSSCAGRHRRRCHRRLGGCRMSALLQVRDLRKSYATRHGPVRAVDGISFDVEAGRTVALVGESGCGKSTIALTLVRLLEADGGEVRFEDIRLGQLSRRDDIEVRRKFGIVFQNPYSSLDPKMRVLEIVGEPLRTVLGMRGRALRERVIMHLEQVGLGPEHVDRYPHEFSGGQRQRIAIARAVALEPRLLILDEPTAALDVSIQAQVLNLLIELQRTLNLAYLFISHNLATVEYVADEVMVMYLGRIVEAGPVETVFAAPRHPYTRALIDSIPLLDPRRRGTLQPLGGDVPSPLDMPEGCAFAPRCRYRSERCTRAAPALEETVLEETGERRRIACFHPLDGPIDGGDA
jgi:peptide/nickel transport system ATP-binding protein